MNLRTKLLEAITAGVYCREGFAIIKIDDDLRRMLEDELQIYYNDPDECKTKTDIIAEICSDLAMDCIKVSPKLTNKALSILKNLGYDIKIVRCYYTEELPVILTCDNVIGVAVKTKSMNSLKDFVVKPLDVYLSSKVKE